jgi:hypothetical protein
MVESLVYNTIAIVETDFQNFQIESLIKNNLIGSKVFLIDLRLGASHPNSKGFMLEGEFYPFNLNNPKDTLNSVFSIMKLRLKYTISCTTLVSTYFHGFSSRFLSNYIDTTNRVLIDDGIGSYIFYSESRTSLESFNYKVKLNFVHMLNAFFTGKRCLVSWKHIDLYFTGYNLERNSHIKTELICYPLWQKSFEVRHGIAFVGSPEVEFSNMPVSLFKKIIDYVYSKHGPFEYYPHRNENMSKFNDDNRLTIRSVNSSLEEFFMSEKCPGQIYGLNSSCLLHLALADTVSVSAFTGYRIDAYDKEVRKVLNLCNVSLINVTEI